MIIIVSFALSGSVMNTIPSGCQEDFLHRGLVDIEFSCLRRGASDDHCDICTVWSCGTHHWPSHLLRRLFRNLG